VDALEEVIQLAWTSETLPESRTKGVMYEFVCVYKKGDKLDCTNYRGIYLLNVAYKVFAKVLYDRLLPYANAVVQHYQAGFNQRQTNSLHCGKSLKKAMYNIQTHHLFIDFKAAYDTIIRNEVYVYVRAQLSYETNTSYDSNCAVLRKNSERLF
jgi:Reverse transcriptase (RNA-dependent DNA polymerase)